MQRKLIGLVATVGIGGMLALACGSGPIDEYASRSSKSALRAEIDALSTALSDAPGCTLEVRSYTAPEIYGGSWSAQARLVVDVAFDELLDVRLRMDRLDSCSAVVAARLSDEVEVEDDTWLSVGTAGPTFVVDAPERHVAALAERLLRQQQAAAAIGGAPQLHPEDRRCVPTGEVTVGERSIAGVELVLVAPCRIPSAPEAPAPS